MPVQTSAHVWANRASIIYFKRKLVTDFPDENLCADCLFIVWHDREPINPPDMAGEFAHFRPGSRDTGWEALVQGNLHFLNALEILKTGVQKAYEQAVAGVA